MGNKAARGDLQRVVAEAEKIGDRDSLAGAKAALAGVGR
jgi:hypothetical protein